MGNVFLLSWTCALYERMLHVNLEEKHLEVTYWNNNHNVKHLPNWERKSLLRSRYTAPSQDKWRGLGQRVEERFIILYYHILPFHVHNVLVKVIKTCKWLTIYWNIEYKEFHCRDSNISCRPSVQVSDSLFDRMCVCLPVFGPGLVRPRSLLK